MTTEETQTLCAHVNELTPEQAKRIIVHGKVTSEGDCGNIWGEKHGCPWPHTIIESPSEEDLKHLRSSDIGYMITPVDAWDDMITEWKWVEDPYCNQRSIRGLDYRMPYGKALSINVEAVPVLKNKLPSLPAGLVLNNI